MKIVTFITLLQIIWEPLQVFSFICLFFLCISLILLARVRHYLLQADDIYAAKKTLPDFLGKCYNLSHIVQVFHDPVRGRVYQQIRKDIVLGEYYSKVGKQDIIPGYEKQL